MGEMEDNLAFVSDRMNGELWRPYAYEAPITYQRETLVEALKDGLPMLQKHWQEIALNKDKVKLKPDYEKYQRAELAGALYIFTARRNGEMAGYAVYLVHSHMHYSDDLFAISDLFWLSPTARGRGAGKGLFEFAEAQLRAAGVSVMATSTKLGHPAAAAVLQSLGHEAIELTFSKCLK